MPLKAENSAPPSSPADTRRVILIGYRGTGKSTVGRLLAQRLGTPFLDTDQEIEARHGAIAAMVAAHGWPLFRARERDLLAELATGGPAVIATGGGAVLHREVWETLKADALVVWLQAPAAVIARRLAADARSASQRPSLTGADICAEIETVLAERTPLYRAAAHCAIDTAGMGAEEIVETILQKRMKAAG